MAEVSVIVACYNQMRYLEQCVDSIRNQSLPNIEIVVVDDASNDGTRALLAKLAGRHRQIVPVYNAENIGVAAVRDLGIRRSTGQYITTLDADDFIISPRKIELEFAALHHNESISAVPIVAYSTTILVDEYGEKSTEKLMGDPNTTISREGIMMRSCYIPRDMFFRRTTYDAVGGFDRSLRIYEDWDLKIRLAGYARYVWSGSEGVAYRIHGQGLSSAKAMAHLSGKHRVLKKYMNEKEFSFKVSCYSKIFLSFTKSLARQYLRQIAVSKQLFFALL